MIILVSPTEPLSIRQIGKVSTVPEKYGSDILLIDGKHRIGIQRKEVTDLVASLYDGRLTRVMALMKELSQRFLFIEGRMSFTTDRELIHPGSRITKAQIYGVLLSVQVIHNVNLMFTTNLLDTADTIRIIEKWLSKSEHNSLMTRPKPVSSWGTRTSRDWALHILQGFPGIGASSAGSIFDHFGRVPLKWDCTPQQLGEVGGIGKKRTEELFKALE